MAEHLSSVTDSSYNKTLFKYRPPGPSTRKDEETWHQGRGHALYNSLLLRTTLISFNITRFEHQHPKLHGHLYRLAWPSRLLESSVKSNNIFFALTAFAITLNKFSDSITDAAEYEVFLYWFLKGGRQSPHLNIFFPCCVFIIDAASAEMVWNGSFYNVFGALVYANSHPHKHVHLFTSRWEPAWSRTMWDSFLYLLQFYWLISITYFWRIAVNHFI